MSLFTREGFLLPHEMFTLRLLNGEDPNEVWCGQRGDQLISRSPLLSAITAPTLDYLRVLLIHPRTDIRAADFQSRNALHLAVQASNVHAMRLLIAAGLPLDARDTYGQTALHYATYTDGAQCVRILLDAGANPDAIGADGRTPIHEAMMEYTAWPHSIEEKVALLMVARCNLNHQDDRGLTPLYRAAYSGYDRIVRALLAAKADPQLRDQDGDRPVDAVRRLVAEGFDQKQKGLDEALWHLTLHTRNRLSEVASASVRQDEIRRM